ncbi:MAG: ABC transporter ATP-binding protein [bacterium]
MSKPIISVCGIGKRYRLGMSHARPRYKTLRDTVADFFKAPFSGGKARWSNSSSSGPVREFWALRDISFDVRQGEVIGIIGRNGAGKSTLLKILSRITEPTEGEIRLRGRVASLLEVGTGFHPELTGRENIFMNGAILGMSRVEIRSRFDEIVAFAEIEKFLDTPVKRYSSGMYVRLAFAVAAHLEPEILLVDEVLAVGDAAFQKKCLGKMNDVARGGRTVLFVSHNMGAISSLCPRCIWLDAGHIRQIGETEPVVQSYLTSSDASGSDTILEPPKTARVGFRRIWVSSCDGRVLSEFDVKHPFLINLAIEVRVPVRDVDIGVLIESVHGSRVCFTNLSDSNDGSIIALEPGKYLCSLRVPGNFLVPDGYKILVEAHIPAVSKEDFHQDAVSFMIVDTGSRLRNIKDAWRYGCVLGNFDWKLERINHG